MSHVLPSSMVDVSVAIGHVHNDDGHIGNYFMAGRDVAFNILVEGYPGGVNTGPRKMTCIPVMTRASRLPTLARR